LLKKRQKPTLNKRFSYCKSIESALLWRAFLLHGNQFKTMDEP